jgi:hypothetical protein
MFASHRFRPVRDDSSFILALSSDKEISEIRIRPFLAALLARGVISGFQFADRDMNSMGWHKDFCFTHIWCHRNVSTAQYRLLRKQTEAPIIYDIDDLLLAPPDFVKPRPRNMRRIQWCLDHAQAVTTSTEALRAHLIDQAASPKTIITLKNGHIGYARSHHPAVRKQVIWTSGDYPFVLRNAPEFLNGLADIVNRNDYEMVLIGRFEPDHIAPFKRVRHIRRIDFNSYRETLRLFEGAIAIAPLPSGLEVQNQTFFDAKSDIKLLDYLSSGLIPVCTAALPYTRSELYIPELGAKNPGELLQMLESCMGNQAGWLARIDSKIHAAGILDQRRFDRLSQELDRIFIG